jgi:addiction module HigA family antidote
MLPTHRPPTTPGEMLREEFLAPSKLSQEALARRLGVTFQTVSRIVNGHQRITADMAVLLGRELGTTAEFWMNAQTDLDLWRARKKLGVA